MHRYLPLLLAVWLAPAQALTLDTGNRVRELSRAELAALPQYRIQTRTLWITSDNGWHRYRGPRLSRLLPATPLRVIGADGYACVITAAQIRRYQPILAIERDGRALPPERAPAWLIFPFASRLDPKDPLPHRAVWSVSRIEIAKQDEGCTIGHRLTAELTQGADGEFY